MTWLNPAAFVGLLALAVPILVHLFGRRIAKRQRFPSLRLLLDARATPVTRSRPSDLLLLILRCGVVVAAVLGLAQPRWLGSDRRRDSVTPVRLVLVDTSASMRRLTSGGGIALDRARLLARQALDSAREGMLVETAQPGANIAGAVSWLSARSGLRELLIVSDFQVGAVSDGNLASVPDGIGLSLRRIDVAQDASTTTSDSSVVTVDAQQTTTRASWRSVPPDGLSPFRLLTAKRDSAAADAMLEAARAVAPGMTASTRGVTVAFPGSLPGSSTTGSLNAAWQGDLLLALRANQLLSDAASSASVSPACAAPGAVVARTSSGVVLASIAADEPGVVIHSCADVGTVAGTALLAAVASALTPQPALQEREPGVLPDEVLRTWERPSTAFAPRGREETSPGGRWFWLVAIALLVVEQLVRRSRITRPVSTDGKVDRERAA
jgi:hypothetical protein